MTEHNGIFVLGYHEVGTQVEDIEIGRYTLEFTFRLHEVHLHLLMDGTPTRLWPQWLIQAINAWINGAISIPLDTYLYKLFGQQDVKIRKRARKKNAT